MEGGLLVEPLSAMKPVAKTLVEAKVLLNAETLIEATVVAEKWLAVPGLTDSFASRSSDKPTDDRAGKRSIVLVSNESTDDCAGNRSSANRDVLSLHH